MTSRDPRELKPPVTMQSVVLTPRLLYRLNKQDIM